MTVLDIIQRSTPYLTKHGVESPRLQVELLLAHVLKLPRLQLYLNFERVLTDPEIDALRLLVQKRGARTPLQHLIGSTGFFGLDIEVTPATLIPRPETELLVEHSLKLVSGLGVPPENIEILDAGTGSGCITLALAAKLPMAHFTALDKSPAAIEVARRNAALHHLEGRITFHTGDWFEALPGHRTFDLIVSNPPYIPTAEIGTLQPEVRDHDPKLALDGGPDGLEVYRHFAAHAARWLKPHGWLVLEMGDDQEGAVTELFRLQNWVVESVLKDYSARPRLVVLHRRRSE